MYIRTNPTIAHACLCTVWSEGTECNQQVSDKQMPPTSDVGSQMQPPQHIHGVRFGKVPGFLPLLFSGQIVVVVVSFVTPTPENVKKAGWCQVEQQETGSKRTSVRVGRGRRQQFKNNKESTKNPQRNNKETTKKQDEQQQRARTANVPRWANAPFLLAFFLPWYNDGHSSKAPIDLLLISPLLLSPLLLSPLLLSPLLLSSLLLSPLLPPPRVLPPPH